MKSLKDRYTNISKKIKHSNLVRFLRSKSIIRGLNEKIEGLEEEKRKLKDIKTSLENQLKVKTELADKIPSMELVINSADKSLKDKLEENKKLNDEIAQLKSDLFNKELELGTANAQVEEYKLQVEDLKSNRYLIKKVPAGRTKNTIKTKLSKPMSARVTSYMRGEHE